MMIFTPSDILMPFFKDPHSGLACTKTKRRGTLPAGPINFYSHLPREITQIPA